MAMAITVAHHVLINYCWGFNGQNALETNQLMIFVCWFARYGIPQGSFNKCYACKLCQVWVSSRNGTLTLYAQTWTMFIVQYCPMFEWNVSACKDVNASVIDCSLLALWAKAHWCINHDVPQPKLFVHNWHISTMKLAVGPSRSLAKVVIDLFHFFLWFYVFFTTLLAALIKDALVWHVYNVICNYDQL